MYNISEQQKEFLNKAIISSENYYNNAKLMKHTRSVFYVHSIKQISQDLYELSLFTKINSKYAEALCLCIQSPLVPNEVYENFNNRYISQDYFSFATVKHTSKTATSIHIKIKGQLLDIFNKIKPSEITLISDLKFLIDNVRKWYITYGHLIKLPSPPILAETELFFRGYESDEQKSAQYTALQNNISYIWGAPGTGKTQIVLANCIMSYIQKSCQVIIIAPTNNAIEQTLRSVISVLREYGQDIDCLYRLGTSTEAFAREYGSICEHGDTQAQIEDIKDTLSDLREQYEQIIAQQKIIRSYPIFEKNIKDHFQFSDMIKEQEELLDASHSKIETVKDALLDVLVALNDINIKAETLSTREKAFSYKFKLIFSDKEATALAREKQLLSLSKQELLEKKESLELQKNSLLNFVSNTEKQLKELNYSLKSALDSAKTIAIECLGHYSSPDETTEEFLSLIKSFDNSASKETVLSEIEKYEDLLKNTITNIQSTTKRKKVFAFTIDHFFAHYKSLADIGLNSKKISHVFLDEAAYCPFIKSGILFSLGIPVTLLGDHMQLPPICEAPSTALDNKDSYLFFWDMSALYFPQLFETDFSCESLFHVYQEHLPPLTEVMRTETLPKTFRFGNNLAKILEEFVYNINFIGQEGFDTSITVVNSERDNNHEEKRTNKKEVQDIIEYIKRYSPKDYAILTPYKNQRKLLYNSLQQISDPDNILTIHASQGREWDTILVSIVDRGDKYLTDSTKKQGLYTLNTALSRAKKNIVIFCDENYWYNIRESQLIGRLVADATQKLNFDI